MAATNTKLSGTITSGANLITLAAYTAPTGTSAVGPKPMGRFASGEYFSINDASLSPTLLVTRGWFGSTAVAHTTGEGISYGLPSDFPAEAPRTFSQMVQTWNTQEVTATGTTGSNAAAIIIPSPGFINTTGASDAGINLPIPIVGDYYVVKNSATTGAVKVYCVGGTINTISGATGVTITQTGDLGAGFLCATAGVWQEVPLST